MVVRHDDRCVTGPAELNSNSKTVRGEGCSPVLIEGTLEGLDRPTRKDLGDVAVSEHMTASISIIVQRTVTLKV
jgi:hypothetical protein